MKPSGGQAVRILRVIARMNVGGPAWQVSVLTRGLEAEKFETRLVTGDVDGGEADFMELRDPGLPVLRIPTLGRSVRILGDFRTLAAIRRAIKEYRPDIVHTHTTKAGLLGRLAAMSCGVPVLVHTFHGHILHGYFSRLAVGAVRLLEAWLAHRTTALVAVGERVRDELIEAGVGRTDQYVVIPPGVETNVLEDPTSARKQLGLPVESPVVLFVGRLTAVKRTDRLIAAMAQVLDRRPDVLLVIVGEGELLNETRRLAATLGPSIRFLGWQRDMAQFYAAADCAILTSDNEGMPVSLIEAAMAGTPAVTTNVGSASEVVVDGVTGFLVKPDPADVAEGLLRLLNDDARGTLGVNARNRALEIFGTERLIDDHERLYEGLVSDRDQPAAPRWGDKLVE